MDIKQFTDSYLPTSIAMAGYSDEDVLATAPVGEGAAAVPLCTHPALY